MLLIVVASISRVYYEDHTAPEDKIRFWKCQGGNCLGNCLAGPSRSNEWGDTLLGGPCWLFMTVLFASLGLGLLTGWAMSQGNTWHTMLRDDVASCGNAQQRDLFISGAFFTALSLVMVRAFLAAQSPVHPARSACERAAPTGRTDSASAPLGRHLRRVTFSSRRFISFFSRRHATRRPSQLVVWVGSVVLPRRTAALRGTDRTARAPRRRVVSSPSSPSRRCRRSSRTSSCRSSPRSGGRASAPR